MLNLFYAHIETHFVRIKMIFFIYANMRGSPKENLSYLHGRKAPQPEWYQHRIGANVQPTRHTNERDGNDGAGAEQGDGALNISELSAHRKTRNSYRHYFFQSSTYSLMYLWITILTHRMKHNGELNSCLKKIKSNSVV